MERQPASRAQSPREVCDEWRWREFVSDGTVRHFRLVLEVTVEQPSPYEEDEEDMG